MATAADRFLASLDKEQLAQATFAFDSPGAAQLALHPPRAQGPADQGDDPRAAGLAFGLLHTGVGRVGLPQGHDDHEPGADPPRAGEGQRAGPRPRALLPHDLRQARPTAASGAGGSRGTTSRSTSRSRTARSSSATPAFFGANPGRGPPGTARGPADPRRRRGPRPPARPGARRRAEEGGRRRRRRRPRTSAPRTRRSRRPRRPWASPSPS